MSKKPTIATLIAGWVSASRLNTILSDILNSFDNTLSRDGSSPNAMEADLDMNNNDILNAKDFRTNRIFVNGTQLVSSVSVPSWIGAWATSTVYGVNNLVRQDGQTYISLEEHTSGTFSTDLSGGKWELFAAKGTPGDGTGDMLASNNLSDLADAETARSNLELGEAATKSTTGNDNNVVSGTPGSDGQIAVWNTDGDVVGGPSVSPDADFTAATTDLANRATTKTFVDASISAALGASTASIYAETGSGTKSYLGLDDTNEVLLIVQTTAAGTSGEGAAPGSNISRYRLSTNNGSTWGSYTSFTTVVASANETNHRTDFAVVTLGASFNAIQVLSTNCVLIELSKN